MKNWDSIASRIVGDCMKGWEGCTSSWGDIVLCEFIKDNRECVRSFYMMKYLQMKVGQIWQRMIGQVDGVVNLGTGHESGLDVMSDESGRFRGGMKFIMELKNSHNSDNSSSKRANLNKLVNWVKAHPEYVPIYGIVNGLGSAKGDWSGEDKIILHDGVKIRYLSGMQLLVFLFGDDSDAVVGAVRKQICGYKM